MSADDHNSHAELVRVGHGGLALTSIADNRILSQMVGASLALAKDSAVAPIDLNALVREGKNLYRKKQGMTEENMRAFELFIRAAKAGHGEAQFLVYQCYRHGDALHPVPSPRLIELRQKANPTPAEKAERTALEKAGGHLNPPPRPTVQSYKWFQLASDQGDEKAGKVAKALAALMSPAEFEEAYALYREFKEKHAE